MLCSSSSVCRFISLKRPVCLSSLVADDGFSVTYHDEMTGSLSMSIGSGPSGVSY